MTTLLAPSVNATTTTSGRVDCSICVVTYNSGASIDALLQSVEAASGRLRVAVVVVDNASTDDTVSRVRDATGVRLVEGGSNLGYAAGINLAMASAPPSAAFLVLNPDLQLLPEALPRMLESLRRPGVGAVVPRLVDSQGRLQHSLRREPSISRCFGDALLGRRLPRRPGSLSEVLSRHETYERAQDVDWATGAAILISEECAAEVGPWDETYFLYSEETDYAARIRAAGLRIRYEPRAAARHDGAGSGSSPSLAALLAVNRVRYFERRHSRAATLVFRAGVATAHLLRARTSAHRRALLAVAWRPSWRKLLDAPARGTS